MFVLLSMLHFVRKKIQTAPECGNTFQTASEEGLSGSFPFTQPISLRYHPSTSPQPIYRLCVPTHLPTNTLRLNVSERFANPALSPVKRSSPFSFGRLCCFRYHSHSWSAIATAAQWKRQPIEKQVKTRPSHYQTNAEIGLGMRVLPSTACA